MKPGPPTSQNVVFRAQKQNACALRYDGAMVKSACSLNVFNSSSCDDSSPKISAIGQAWVSMPLLNGLIMFRSARLEMQVYQMLVNTHTMAKFARHCGASSPQSD